MRAYLFTVGGSLWTTTELLELANQIQNLVTAMTGVASFMMLALGFAMMWTHHAANLKARLAAIATAIGCALIGASLAVGHMLQVADDDGFKDIPLFLLGGAFVTVGIPFFAWWLHKKTDTPSAVAACIGISPLVSLSVMTFLPQGLFIQPLNNIILAVALASFGLHMLAREARWEMS